MPALDEISKQLGFAPQHIFALVATNEQQYVEAKLAKHSDPTGFRTIDIPRRALKGVQKQILRAILNEIEIDPSAFAYVKNRSLVSAAQRLAGQKAVLKIDISDFFPTISSKRVFGMFRSLGYADASCFILTKLCTYNGYLPQGAPTSPAISNIVLRCLDANLRTLSEKWEMEYTRYSDDMFFTHRKNFNHPEFLKHIRKYIENSGFSINDGKTRFYARGVPRKTLGLLTHGSEPKIPGPMRRLMRAAFFKGSRNIGWGQDHIEYLRGLLEWYKCVYGRDETYASYRSVVETITRIKLHISYQSV